MTLRWFLSKTVRQATDLRRQARIVVNEQRDVLNPNAAVEFTRALEEFDRVTKSAKDDAVWEKAATDLEAAAAKWLQPYPNPGPRENLKEFLVSAVFILSIFCFFAQPMKIPTGSAQPTLFGNVITDARMDPSLTIPSGWGKVKDWFLGLDYYDWVAADNGEFRMAKPDALFGIFKRQRFSVGSDTFTAWFPAEQLAQACAPYLGVPFHKGDSVLKMRILNGDRLFVDRLTYNFRHPKRGETIVFDSTGIPEIIQNTYYIKRLIGLPSEHIRIGNDRHVIVNGKRLDGTTPHFENVYAFSGPPHESIYSGHVNELVARDAGRGGLARHFPDENAEFIVRPHHFLAFGDNTMNSNDGRNWGDFPNEKVVGKALFVFWPLTSRFGLVNR